MPSDLGYPEQRSDGQGPHPKVEQLFITRQEFHEYVLDNRDRQDENKTEILDAIEKIATKISDECHDDIDDLGGRVGNLEDVARKQNVIAATIAGVVSLITASIGAAVAFYRGG